MSGDRWPDDVRFSELEPWFICSACGKRGADVRPDFSWNRKPVSMMGFRCDAEWVSRYCAERFCDSFEQHTDIESQIVGPFLIDINVSWERTSATRHLFLEKRDDTT